MFRPAFTGQFRRDRKRARKRGWDVEHLDEIVARLTDGETLSARYRMHTLRGGYKDYWECHVEPDFLLIWYYSADDEIVFVRTGSHADLF